MAGGEPRFGTTATYMRRHDHRATCLSIEIDRLHDRLYNEYQVFSAASVRKWSKFGLGWRAVLAEHEAAWDARWAASDIVIDGNDIIQRAVRFAVYHLTSTANPEDDRVSIGARALTGDAYIGHVF